MKPEARDQTFPILRIYVSAIVTFSLLRMAFFVCHYPVFSQASLPGMVRGFLNGLVIDSSVTATTLLAIRLVTLLIQVASRSTAARVHSLLIYICFGLFFFVNLADIAYFNVFDSRFNILLIENLGQIVPAVLTVIAGYALYIVVAGWIVAILVFVWLNRRIRFRDAWPVVRYPKISALVSMVILVGLSFLWTRELPLIKEAGPITQVNGMTNGTRAMEGPGRLSSARLVSCMRWPALTARS